MARNSHVQKIISDTSQLTHDSYPSLLKLVESNHSIVELQCAIIFPLKRVIGMYLEAIKRVLNENKNRLHSAGEQKLQPTLVPAFTETRKSASETVEQSSHGKGSCPITGL